MDVSFIIYRDLVGPPRNRPQFSRDIEEQLAEADLRDRERLREIRLERARRRNKLLKPIKAAVEWFVS